LRCVQIFLHSSLLLFFISLFCRPQSTLQPTLPPTLLPRPTHSSLHLTLPSAHSSRKPTLLPLLFYPPFSSSQTTLSLVFLAVPTICLPLMDSLSSILSPLSPQLTSSPPPYSSTNYPTLPHILHLSLSPLFPSSPFPLPFRPP